MLFKYPSFLSILGQNFMIFLFLELAIFLFEFKDLILGGAGDAVDVCRRFQTRATPVSSRGSSGVAIGTWSFLSCRLLVQHWPHPHTRPSLIVSSPRFLPPPARRAVRMQGISEHQTHSTHDASRCPVSEDCHLFSVPRPETESQMKAIGHRRSRNHHLQPLLSFA